MFVPKVSHSSTDSIRSTRRRQRTSLDDADKPPRAKRQRSALRYDSHELPSLSQTSSIAQERVQEHASNNLTDLRSTAEHNAAGLKDIPIRVLREQERRETENDGTVVLSKTDFYTVSQLPSLPEAIRSLHTEPIRCFFGEGHEYALAMTKSHAITWPYSATSSPSPADIFTLTIPEPCREPSEAVPFGVLLSAATSDIPGLMIVMPYSGKIIYWETMSSAASLGLPRQRPSGIHGQIHNLLSGEHVVDIVNGEPSGVVVTFSSGRVAHVTFRDTQGKAAVIVNFLRSSSGSNVKTGLLGGIKNVFGGGFWRKDVSAVRAGDSRQRGQRDILIATSSGVFEIWDTHWNNGCVLKRQFDAKHKLCQFLGPKYVNGAGEPDFRVLDFTFSPGNHITSDRQKSDPESWQICAILAPPRGASSTNLCLMQILLSENIDVISTNTVTLHHNSEDTGVKLLLPAPGDTAFIIANQSVTLLSLAGPKESPTSHLLLDPNQQRPSLYDSIVFRSGKEYDILGNGVEAQNNDESFCGCLLMIREFGVVRITTSPRKKSGSDIEDAQVSAKDKLEQAIFYGTMSDNPLNLANKSCLDFSAKEIEQAALEICKDLLQSTSRFIPRTAISLDQNLRLRAKAIDDLASLLKQQNKNFDRQTWWELLWSAEKLAAQRSMWKLEEAARKSQGREPTFLAHVIGLMSEKFKTKLDERAGESDPVRHWFLHDTFRMEHIVPWISNAIRPHKGQQPRQGRKAADQILDASELSLAVLETAFRYRDEHASQYGLNDGYLEDGVYIDSYSGLPEFWTSRGISYVETGHLLDLELDSCRAWIQQMSTCEAPESLRKISKNCARQLRVLGQMHSERMRWLAAQGNTKMDDESITAERAHVKHRKWQLFKLAGIGQLGDAIALAEKFGDMEALVELIIELQDQTKTQIISSKSPQHSHNAPQSEAEQLTNKVSQYFDKFGESWADAFFSRQISMGQAGILFSMKRFQPFITQFLRKNTPYSRLCWINSVIGENDYDAAAKSLERLAIQHEGDIWSHRVELSLAKLANLAAWEKTPSSQTPPHDDIRRLEDLAEISAVQEVVFAYVAPALQGAIDQKAEVDLAIDHFGKSIATERPSFHEVLGDALTKLITRQVINVDQLVDLLTLIDTVEVSAYGQNELLGKEFYFALRVIRLGHFTQQHPLYHLVLQKLVWRRCMIKDDWADLGCTVEKMGDGSEQLLHDTALSHTLNLCLRDRYTNDPNYPPLYVPLSPRDVLLSDSDSELISSRFRPEQRDRILRDLNHENERLLHYLDKGGLEFWFKTFTSYTEESGPSSANMGDTGQPGHDEPDQIGEKGPLHVADGLQSKTKLSWL
ncbi:hypothetical protein P168DRAFT_306102 [Aspergillus campestris IBT 28561]|uniref:Non-repetitive/WGA-negative nucleoporin C-terminal-domain-containing protein n=1 Tax=Aspergillus campestris (strain IBT 28561) TaxID=1392248 RepID=A0A2I1CW41_ASPC2|nr:uncharacterized protein P168DRAFT_306102 [Aspergillus campestris IBT 28561]PKY01840.1 hypothetical protein P168DRAFT_306102 [Aspergillus campestris IBT 28561]